MTRISGVSARDAGLRVKLAYYFTRRQIAQLTLFAELREHLDEVQLVELTSAIALENMRGRFNLALGIGEAGFSEGMVCAVPATAAEPRLRSLGDRGSEDAARPGHVARLVRKITDELPCRSYIRSHVRVRFFDQVQERSRTRIRNLS
jgi:hypothetical protein